MGESAQAQFAEFVQWVVGLARDAADAGALRGIDPEIVRPRVDGRARERHGGDHRRHHDAARRSARRRRAHDLRTPARARGSPMRARASPAGDAVRARARRVRRRRDAAAGRPRARRSRRCPVASVSVVRESIVEPVLGTGTIAAHKTTDIGPARLGHHRRDPRARWATASRRATRSSARARVDYEIRVREAESARAARARERREGERDLERIMTLHGRERGVGRTSRRRAHRARDGGRAARPGRRRARTGAPEPRRHHRARALPRRRSRAASWTRARCSRR